MLFVRAKETLPQRIFAGEELPDERLIHNGDPVLFLLGKGHIGAGKEAPGLEAQSDHIEILSAHVRGIGHGERCEGRLRASLNIEVRNRDPVERQIVNHGHRRDSRH